MATAPITPEFDRLKNLADTIVHQQHWNASTVLFLAASLAAEVNKFVSLSGIQKKQLVLAVVRAEFQEAVASSSVLSGQSLISQELRASLNFLIEEALPATLDTLVAVARGKFDLKKVQESCFRGCLACIPVLCAVAGKEVPVIRPVAELVIRMAPNPLKVEAEAAVSAEQPTKQPSSSVTETTSNVGSDKETAPPKTTDAATEVLRAPEVPLTTPHP